MTWVAVLAASAACYALKLAGHSLPAGALNDARLQRVAALLPVALLPALIALQTFARGHDLTIDAHLAGVLVAIVAQLLRAPFLVVVMAGGAAAALVRLVT
jgi:uncharacterized membrane protein